MFPSVYQHDQLPDACRYIRLVEIHRVPTGDLLVVTIKAYHTRYTPPYTALSYTWGDRQLTREILANGKLLRVTDHCWMALHQLHLHNVCNYYWVDAICINQADDVEKSAQVNLMGSIYRNAALGAIAVGSHDRLTQDLFSRLDKLGIAQDPTEAKPMLEQISHVWLEKLARDLIAFSKLAYWDRLWIVQEFALAPQAVVLCGHDAIKFDAIEAVAHTLGELQQGHDPAFVTRYDKAMWDSTPMSSTMRLRQVIRESTDGLAAFETVLALLGPRKCVDIRDRLFGILSLVQWDAGVERLVADYSLSRTALAVRALPLYKGHAVHGSSRVLSLLEIGPDDGEMWDVYNSRLLGHSIRSAVAHRRLGFSARSLPTEHKTTFSSTAEAFQIPKGRTLYSWSDRWRCLSPTLKKTGMEDMTPDLEAWLANGQILLPAVSQPGDILVRISRQSLPNGDHDDHVGSDKTATILDEIDSVLVLRMGTSEEVEYQVVGHALVVPHLDFSSLSKYNLAVIPNVKFHVHVDDGDLLFWVWQHINWGSKRCETTEDWEQRLRVFATNFCHSPASSFATSWPRYCDELEDAGMQLDGVLARSAARSRQGWSPFSHDSDSSPGPMGSG